MLIFLVGFMGCGKSYTGKSLAQMLDYSFVDMDKYIEEQEKMSIPEIFERHGEMYFRALEKKYIEEVAENQRLVIATGGGAPCFFNNMDIMNSKGITIYLNRNKERALQQLLKGKHKRPLLKGMTDEEVSTFYDMKLAERSRYYEQAKIKAGDMYAEDLVKLLHLEG
ncbi:MAG: shikimate kinase [Chitinophagales bacterium]|nr:shikimate kinase [Chitinophagales bacterium]